MRIAFFTDTFIPKVDGIVTTIRETVKSLTGLGHDVLIFAPAGGVDEYEQARIIGMKGRSFAIYPELKLSLPRASMRTALTEFRPDIIHVVEPALLGLAGLYYGGGNNGGALHVPLVVSYHTDLPKYLAYYRLRMLDPVCWPLLRIRHNRATVNLCTSEAMVKQLEEHGIQRVALWPGGVDGKRFHPSRRTDEMRLRLSEGHPESPLLMCVGRLSAEKDLERLKPILQAMPHVRLALVGDGPHRKALEQHFAGFPVYFTGYMHGEELASAYASSDIFVMTSRTETLGLVILEAMCSELPVVAARAGGIPELIIEGESGYLFDDESEAVAAIKELLGSREKMAVMGKCARTHGLAQSWEAATSRLLELYQEACERQHIGNSNGGPPPRSGLRVKAKRMAGRATLSVIRKLLP